MRVSADQFRKTLGLFPTGVTIVTASSSENQDIGMTISSLTSLSLSPPQILFCLSKRSKNGPAFHACSYFAVNILKDSQAFLADSFARHLPLEWEKISPFRHPETGCRLITGALGYIICEKGPLYEGGDHDIIIGHVIDLTVNTPALPLIRQRGHYLTTTPLLADDLQNIS